MLPSRILHLLPRFDLPRAGLLRSGWATLTRFRTPQHRFHSVPLSPKLTKNSGVLRRWRHMGTPKRSSSCTVLFVSCWPVVAFGPVPCCTCPMHLQNGLPPFAFGSLFCFPVVSSFRSLTMWILQSSRCISESYLPHCVPRCLVDVIHFS
jgi:hypothetical protein